MISYCYMRVYVYHCFKSVEMGFLQALMLPDESTVADTIIKEKIDPRRLGYIQVRVISDTVKILTSQVTSRCRYIGFHVRIIASLLLAGP